MSQYEGFFLHYGPGGNSDAEKLFLAKDYPKIYFWDQPPTATFNQLVESACDHFNSIQKLSKIRYLVGHSFGCDLAQTLAHKLDLEINMLLAAPVCNLPNAFCNLAQRVLEQSDLDPTLSAVIQSKKLRVENSPRETSIIWDLVFTIYQYPQISRLFWHNEDMYNRYVSLAPSFKPLDLESWQRTLDDYIMRTPEPHPQFSSKTQVLIGQHDPYYAQLPPHPDWNGGKVKISSLSGHYPHLEDLGAFAAALSLCQN